MKCLREAVFTLALIVVSAVSVRAADVPTFVDEIAPIVHQKCTVCHRPGQSGPFPLITYRDVAKRAETIKAVVNDRYMPPWKAVGHDVAFAHDRRLTSAELKTINQWVDGGRPEGDPGRTPRPPVFPDGWRLGKPDLVIQMKQPFEVPAAGPDLYRSFVFRVDLPEDRWVKAVELRPQARGAVHHALFYVDTQRAARDQDGRDGQPGIEGMKFLRRGGRSDDSGGVDQNLLGLGGYVPGAMPNRLPEDLAMRLPARSDIVMQTHFHPSGKPETEQAELALYFADRAPTRKLAPLQLPALFGLGAGIDVPAGEKNFVVTDQYKLPVDVRAYQIGGHAHYICKEMSMTASLPSGRTFDLVRIEDWDLDWQDQYQFAHPVDLPAGTTLRVRLVYDNSADNPENPHQPPRRIRWGRESTDEMGSLTLLTVASTDADRARLMADTRQRNVEAVRGRLHQVSGGLVSDSPIRGFWARRLDRNRDGALQSEEIPSRIRERVLKAFDKDGDGVLSTDELNRAEKGADKGAAK